MALTARDAQRIQAADQRKRDAAKVVRYKGKVALYTLLGTAAGAAVTQKWNRASYIMPDGRIPTEPIVGGLLTLVGLGRKDPASFGFGLGLTCGWVRDFVQQLPYVQP